MKRALVFGGLATAGVVGAGVWLKRQAQQQPQLRPVEPEATQVPLVIPGRVAVERVFGDDDPGTPLPLVVALHGVGADETQLAPFILTDRALRLVLLRGSVRAGNGFQWFAARFKASNGAQLLAEVNRVSGEIMTAIDLIASQRRVTERIVIGYSQGAHVAWWLATTGRVDRVVAMSGALPASFKPPRPSRAVRVEAVHGMRDSVILYSAGQTTARAFQAAGYAVRLTPVRLGGHGLSGMGSALAPALSRALTSGGAGVTAGRGIQAR